MSSPTAHNNEYLMHLLAIVHNLPVVTHIQRSGLIHRVLNIFSPFHYSEAPQRVQQATCLTSYLKMLGFFGHFLFLRRQVLTT